MLTTCRPAPMIPTFINFMMTNFRQNFGMDPKSEQSYFFISGSLSSIRILTDPDPQHSFIIKKYTNCLTYYLGYILCCVLEVVETAVGQDKPSPLPVLPATALQDKKTRVRF